MKYSILISYTTGDSFRSWTETDQDIGLVFENGELATKAAKLIQEHNEFVKDNYRSTPQSQKKKLKECLKKEWYVNYCKAGGVRDREHDWYDVSSRIGFEVAPGEFRHMSYPVWLGYFENLITVRTKAFDPNEITLEI